MPDIVNEVKNTVGLNKFAFYYGAIGLVVWVTVILPMLLKVDKTWKDRERMEERLKDCM